VKFKKLGFSVPLIGRNNENNVFTAYMLFYMLRYYF